ncbi:hypothetical protein DOTSEDRAFT_25005 [Dothistroma septosporum NZE10]|uniref:Uncharacterized protein n=1 Tax=Dothistroma septosporum (strain NZE10 / CBS 128990) TaxID=675120 RepID=M2Y3Z4_DOTSN|nr:hypothetical protein DOTSEDRAFT_25005 [Dothistroma septosporum NZE10]
MNPSRTGFECWNFDQIPLKIRPGSGLRRNCLRYTDHDSVCGGYDYAPGEVELASAMLETDDEIPDFCAYRYDEALVYIFPVVKPGGSDYETITK